MTLKQRRNLQGAWTVLNHLDYIRVTGIIGARAGAIEYMWTSEYRPGPTPERIWDPNSLGILDGPEPFGFTVQIFVMYP